MLLYSVSEDEDFEHDSDDMDPEIAAAYEQFLEEMLQNAEMWLERDAG